MPGHSKPEDLMLQNVTPLRKSAPWPPNISDEHVSCTAPARENVSLRSSSHVPRLPSFLEMLQNHHVLLTFDKVQNPLRLPRNTTLQLPKTARKCGAFSIMTSKCASRHNGVHFFNITTSKNGPNVWCFLHILTLTCALCHNGCIFSTSKLPKAVRRKPNPKATNQKPSGHADGKF